MAERPWGRPRADDHASLQLKWEAQLGVTAASVSAVANGEVKLTQDEVRELLDRITARNFAEPFNSDVSRFAQGLAMQLSTVLSQRLGEEWDTRAAAIADELGARAADPKTDADVSAASDVGAGAAECKTQAGVSAASGVGVSAAAGSLADVPPPAPGYHDAKAFPELDSQRVPTDLCDAAAVRESAGMGSAGAGPSAEAGAASASSSAAPGPSAKAGAASASSSAAPGPSAKAGAASASSWAAPAAASDSELDWDPWTSESDDESPGAATVPAMSLEDIGWTEGLSAFTGIDAQGFLDLAPIATGIWCRGDTPASVAGAAVSGMQERGVDISKRTALGYMEQMRLQFNNMERRRENFLRRFASNITEETVEDFMREHRQAFNNSEGQRRFCALDRQQGMKEHQVRGRLNTRFNSMLQELYGGRRAIRTYLRTGRFVDIRLPPLGRLPEGERLPMPKPRSRPNGPERRAKYYSRLAADLEDAARTNQTQNPCRSTKLWQEFLPQARQGEYRSSLHRSAAAMMNHARERELSVSAGHPYVSARASSRDDSSRRQLEKGRGRSDRRPDDEGRGRGYGEDRSRGSNRGYEDRRGGR